ncbi:MAG: metalloregulator ArsR/SmtB family transcription factor [Candidatus Microbacterium phytovorans]|uniref:Metalloregulator ArsR/SmtB family transcription factor n=1 Tax=Candidatus Microbacterium phytovorans TaxID=3121374 RepID=A0AAJ6B4L8_9MICO|nr:metalloregulator ArsR/SmtB family transcription factor [Microbacterium sp.]WEK14284.1 MAG: metalloregulator ArsR/SmtB family transcription factor [Microbacterium sp.]
MNSFDLLADPVRRRIVEILANADRTSGEISRAIGSEFGISQPAVSNQLRVLRDGGVAEARADGARRLYALRPEALDEAAAWVAEQRARWTHRLDALDTELRRGIAHSEQERREDHA